MKGFLVFLMGLSLTLMLTGCSKDTKVVVKLVLNTEEGVEAASNVKLDILPYDIEAMKESLREKNKSPMEPSREELLRLRSEYEKVNAEYNDHLEEYRKAESKVKEIKDIRSRTYEKAYRRYTAAKAKNKELNKRREEVRSDYIKARKSYDQKVKEWEEVAYKGLDEEIARIREGRGITEDYLIKTDKEGIGRVVVPGGEWWINGKERHPNKKYTWLIWNVPFEATGGVLEVELTQDDAREWTE